MPQLSRFKGSWHTNCGRDLWKAEPFGLEWKEHDIWSALEHAKVTAQVEHVVAWQM
jgi:hypothetical protein